MGLISRSVKLHSTEMARRRSTQPLGLRLGRAVAALLSFKILPDDENDKSEPVLSRLKNKRCYISSFLGQSEGHVGVGDACYGYEGERLDSRV